MLNYKKAKKINKVSLLRFNKEQKEGFARFIDTTAAAAFIGAVVGMTGHSSISKNEIGLLVASTIILLSTSLKLRRSEK